jgi:hypothetical protein
MFRSTSDTRDGELPFAYERLAAVWELSQDQRDRLWLALVGSAEPVVAQWRHRLRAMPVDEAKQGTASALRQRFGTPAQVVDLLETLYEGGQLSRRETTAMEESILQHVDRYGTWRVSGRIEDPPLERSINHSWH